MAYIVVPSRRLQAPTRAVSLRPQYELNLVSFLGPRELLGHQTARLLTYGTATQGGAAGKAGWVFANSTADRISNDDATLNTLTCASGLTFMAGVTIRASIAGSHMVGALANASDHRLRVYMTDTNNVVSANANASASGISSSANSAWNYGVTAYVGGVFAGVSSRTSYVNGVASTTNTTNSGTGTALDRLSYGLYSGSADQNALDGTIHYAGFWNRIWPSAEIIEFQRYPYMWVQEYRHPVYFFAAAVAAGGGFGAYFANSANTMIQTPTT